MNNDFYQSYNMNGINQCYNSRYMSNNCATNKWPSQAKTENCLEHDDKKDVEYKTTNDFKIENSGNSKKDDCNQGLTFIIPELTIIVEDCCQRKKEDSKKNCEKKCKEKELDESDNDKKDNKKKNYSKKEKSCHDKKYEVKNIEDVIKVLKDLLDSLTKSSI